MKKVVIVPILLSLVLVAGLFISSCSSPAETTAPAVTTAPPPVTTAEVKPLEFKFASSNSNTHPQSLADIAWMDKISKETGGRLKVTPYWGGALMKSADAYDELVKGVADLVEFSGAYVAQGFDVEKAMRTLFYGCKDQEVARKVYDEVRSRFSIVNDEFAKVKVMAYHAVSPYNLITISKPVRSIADFKGLSFKTTGDFGAIAGKLGGTGVTIAMADTPVALQKGTVDGAFTPLETLKSFNFADYIKYVTYLNMTVGPTPHRAMNLQSYAKLSPDVKKIVDDSVLWWGMQIEKELFAADDAGVALAKSKGAEFITLPKAELEKYFQAVDLVCYDVMAKLEAKGIQGATIYTQIRNGINKYNAQ